MKRRNIIKICLIVISGILLIFGNSCKKDEEDKSIVKDFDGNVYHTVIIGTQTWMVENLRTTKYNDGTIISNVTGTNEWLSLSTPAYCWYNNDEITYKETYGALYNWYTIKTGKLCPSGWHVPTDAEWKILIDYLGGENMAGIKLKEIGRMHWNKPTPIHWSSTDTLVDNSSGFTALPGGCRDNHNGIFEFIGNNGYWWSSSDWVDLGALGRTMSYDYSIASSYPFSKKFGFSVRCVND